jgi:hypothetical protein
LRLAPLRQDPRRGRTVLAMIWRRGWGQVRLRVLGARRRWEPGLVSRGRRRVVCSAGGWGRVAPADDNHPCGHDKAEFFAADD